MTTKELRGNVFGNGIEALLESIMGEFVDHYNMDRAVEMYFDKAAKVGDTLDVTICENGTVYADVNSQVTVDEIKEALEDKITMQDVMDILAACDLGA